MIHPDDALAMMASYLRTPGSGLQTETVGLLASLGRALPQTVASHHDQPPFDKAAMDGWAWQPAAGETLPAAPLSIRGVIAAGKAAEGDSTSGPILPGQAARIMTGAALPPGATRIQRFEWAEESAGSVRFTKADGLDNIIRQGENARVGDILLSPRIIGAQDIAVLAADGRAKVTVAKPVIVGIFSTGTELAEPGEELSGSRIYDSNRPQIQSQLPVGLCSVRDLGSLPDDYESTLAAVKSALATCELLILSGGVSMGDFDYVPRALKAAGVQERFHGVAMKPGKPTFFGEWAGGETGAAVNTDVAPRCLVIGLPGNPVSVFVNTELLVKPLLSALCGIEFRPLDIPVPVAETLTRKGTDRVEFLPVRVEADGARPVRYGGSSAIQALAGADGFIRMDIGVDRITKGGLAHVRFVR
ncbi:MAG: molybdopterin molybdotransferase MoeA [Spirochaetia bacterium]|jgi:molybdopterin molybdotransferase|nr:molybdopterin molybdotransferase MoeA [Spirochaetia bacterium]